MDLKQEEFASLLNVPLETLRTWVAGADLFLCMRKHPYEPGFTDNLSSWIHADDGNVDYVTKMISDRYSFSAFEIDARS